MFIKKNFKGRLLNTPRSLVQCKKLDFSCVCSFARARSEEPRRRAGRFFISLFPFLLRQPRLVQTKTIRLLGFILKCRLPLILLILTAGSGVFFYSKFN